MTEPLSFSQVRLASLQLLFLQFQGLDSESPIHPGRQQSQPEDDKGDGGNSGGAKCGDAYGVRQVRWHAGGQDRKSTRLNSSHGSISYAVFCLKKKKKKLMAIYTNNSVYTVS